MPPPPPKRNLQVTPPGWTKLQPNRLFDTDDEVKATYPGCIILRKWQTNQFGCEIAIPPKLLKKNENQN
jgi:hypothetical protein